MLSTGEPRMHEPAFEPKEEDYLLWDYAKGYVDALADTGLNGAQGVDVRSCPWCEAPIELHFAFCPRCGRQTAPARLLAELGGRGGEEGGGPAPLGKGGVE